MRLMISILLAIALTAGAALGIDISMQISGPGAIDATTIKAGEKVSVDIYWDNDLDDRRAFTHGFVIKSDDIKNIIHVADSGKGIKGTAGDIKAHNGWEGSGAWDFNGVFTVAVNWDGLLPDNVGFGGLVVKNVYNSHEKKKVLSWEMIVPEAGTIVIDSAFFAPGGIWTVVGPEGEGSATWDGPHTYKVVK